MRLHAGSRAFSPAEPIEKGKIQGRETSELLNNKLHIFLNIL